ncbi:hypothetical protein M758_2G023300 [Ceratodon purpureus]|nr:hypothetical protein M758_2G023300 [Ceratodon purpureus]
MTRDLVAGRTQHDRGVARDLQTSWLPGIPAKVFVSFSRMEAGAMQAQPILGFRSSARRHEMEQPTSHFPCSTQLRRIISSHLISSISTQHLCRIRFLRRCSVNSPFSILS